MALNPSAFGPLSPASARAATLLGGPSFSGLNLSRLTGRSFGEPQQAAQSPQEPVGLATGSAAPVEEQQPLLPQGEATGERGDITQLPGFQAAVAPGGAAELPSSAELSPSEQQTASEVRNQLNRLASEGGGSQSAIDAAKALKATSATLKLGGGLKRLAQAFETPGAVPPAAALGGLSMSDITNQGNFIPQIWAPPGAPPMPTQGDISPDIVAPPGAESMPGQGVEGAAGGTSALSRGIGGATAGLGAITAILGLLAGDDPELQKAAKAAGAATAAGSLAGTGASAAGGFAGAGLGTAVGAAAAPITAALLADSINQLLGGEPIYDFGEMFGGSPKYQSFVPKVMRNERQQGIGFNTLTQALPLVQTKEELGRLVNAAKHYASSTTGIALDQTDPYTLAAIPGTGPVTHGQQTPSIDWGPQQQQLQAAINVLKDALPGNPLTQSYEQGGGLSGEPAMRLWTQFLDREQTAPRYLPQDVAPQIINPGMPGAMDVPGLAKGFYAPGQLPAYGTEALNAALRYGQPGYDYAGAGYPEPGQFLGTPSDTWQSLVGQLAGTAPTDTTAAAAPTDSSALLALQRLVAQSGGQAGSLSPNVPQEFVSALRSPAALQSLLQQPGLLARLFAPQQGATA